MNEKLTEAGFIDWVRTKLAAGEQVLLYPTPKTIGAMSGKLNDWRDSESVDAVSIIT